MKIYLFFVLYLITFSATDSSSQEYRETITIFVENKSPFPNRVQVQDIGLKIGLSEDCRIARRIAELCDGDHKKELRPPPRENMSCAAALVLIDEPRCVFKDLIFDDWIDGGMKVRLTIYPGNNEWGTVKVRALNNTESWTTKPGLRDGDIVGHQ
jgi:hypothetical protein